MFTTKTYTINLLISEIAALPVSRVTTLSKLATAISPRAGVTSAKVAALDLFLEGNLAYVINGVGTYANLGKTGRTRVIRALRLRKTN